MTHAKWTQQLLAILGALAVNSELLSTVPALRAEAGLVT